jgi:hypothetical protein
MIAYSYADYIEADFGTWGIFVSPTFNEQMQDPHNKAMYERWRSVINMRVCPYCSSSPLMLTVGQEHIREFLGDNHLVKQCAGCGWWFYVRESYVTFDNFQEWRYYEGIIQRYDVRSIETPLGILKQHLTRKFEDVRHIHHRTFEALCRDIFSEHFDCDVRLTTSTRDGGIDLYAVLGDKRYVIQVKRRAKTVAEGVEPIRAFLGAMVTAGETNGIFVTTAERFSRAAQSTAIALPLRSHGIRLELVDYQRLQELFSGSVAAQQPPWQALGAKEPELYKYRDGQLVRIWPSPEAPP